MVFLIVKGAFIKAFSINMVTLYMLKSLRSFRKSFGTFYSSFKDFLAAIGAFIKALMLKSLNSFWKKVL